MLIMNSLILLIAVSCSVEETKVDSSNDKPAAANSENEDDDSSPSKPKKTEEPAVPTVPHLPSKPPYRTTIFVLPPPVNQQEPPATRNTETVTTADVLATSVGQVFSVMIDSGDQPSGNSRTIVVRAYNGDNVVEQALVNVNNITGNNDFYNLSRSNPLPVTIYLFFTAKAMEDMVNRLVISVDGEKISEATVRLSTGNKTLTAREDDQELVFSFSPLPGGSAIYLRYFKLLAVDNNGQRETIFDTIKDTARLQDELERQHYRLTISNFPCQAGRRVFAWQPENDRGEIVPAVERFYYQATCP